MKKFFLLPLSLLMTFMLLTWSCEEEDSDDDSCVRFDSPECATLVFSACSDSQGDYYLYNDDKYYCSDYPAKPGEDVCAGAADEIVKDSQCTAPGMAKESSLKSGMNSHISFMLAAMNEVRAEAKKAAGCN